MELDLFDYDTIAQVPGAYAGKFNKGTYSIWVPSNDNDMLMREFYDYTKVWEFPFIVVSGIYQVPDNADGSPGVPPSGALKIRTCFNYEYITWSRTMVTSLSPQAPWKILHANNMLRGFKTSMENPLHWAAIKNVLNKAKGWAEDAFGWFNNNKEWILPAAAGVATLL
jgi:hypothetical protein